MRTEWRFKVLDNYPNRIICDDGTIYNEKGVKLSLKPNRDKYLRIRMYDKGKEYYKWAHRAVAYAFVGDCTGLEVDHIDRVRWNNDYTNLRILTKQENLDLRQYGI